jgi:dihydroorotase
MTVLLKHAQPIGFEAGHSATILDIAVENGVITAIGNDLSYPDASVIDLKGAYLAPGLMDMFCWNGDPGYEHRETISSLIQAGQAGGFTDLALLPNSRPVVDKKSMVDLLREKGNGSGMTLHVYGALSEKAEGNELAELLDMHMGGAIAFSDGVHPVQSGALLYRALEYAKIFNGLIVQSPSDRRVFSRGQMHEGAVSTRLGLRGIPVADEMMALEQCLELLRYTQSRLHLTGISSARAVERIRQAKAEGLPVTASVPVWNVAYTDESVSDFNFHFKLDPPLRSETDRQALISGLKDGTLDALYSQHLPWDPEKKNLEFPYSSAGSVSLQTAFPLSVEALSPYMSLQEILTLWTSGPRRVLGLEETQLREGMGIRAMAYAPEVYWTLSSENNRSLSHNSPLWEKELKGKILGTFSGKTINML